MMLASRWTLMDGDNGEPIKALLKKSLAGCGDRCRRLQLGQIC